MPIENTSRPMVGVHAEDPRSVRLATAMYQNIRLKEAAYTAKSHPHSPAAEQLSAHHQFPIKVVCVSDTHNRKPKQVPPGDVLVHAGDLSQYGTFPEIQAQLTWLNSLPHRLKVVIGGNHDLLLDTDFAKKYPDRELERHAGQRKADLDWGSVQYLQHETVELTLEQQDESRALWVLGSPWTPCCGNWAFQYGDDTHDSSGSGFAWSSAIPKRTNLLIVHGPPKGHLDNGGKGCPSLLEELWRVRPALVVCGHIHPGRGEELLWFDSVQRCYDNVILQKQILRFLCVLAVWYAWVSLANVFRVTTARSERTPTRIINASITTRYGEDGKPLVADI